MDKNILEKARSWADNPVFDAAFREEIKQLLDNNDESELTDRFYKDLAFGTGGLRGILGAGSNRMNIYTVGKATQGLATYIREYSSHNSVTPSVAIAYDSRNKSDLFARHAASVMAANGIRVYLYPELKPVPMLSYAVRTLQTTAGIVITASHNPPEYNGYKVYWSDGCQVTPPHDNEIIGRVNKLDDFSSIKRMDYSSAIKKGLIETIPSSLESSYFDKIEALSFGNKSVNKLLKVTYTPLHGSGNLPVREILKRRGFEQVSIIKAQEAPDGDFPTVVSPNPEETETLRMAVESAGGNDDIIIGTDPDADRIGAMVAHDGMWRKINGNQIGQLMLAYYLEKLKTTNTLPADGVFVTTIVTSPLGEKIAKSYGVRTVETLTGFKYIGAVIAELEERKSGTFIFATEESHGYLFGDFVRDKDAIVASMIFSEMCAELKKNGKTAIDQLKEIYQTYGFHTDSLVNLVIEGQSGAVRIKEIMDGLRKNQPKEIANVPIVMIKDYLTDQVLDCLTGEIRQGTGQGRSDVMAFFTRDGSRITARPSGTEPKIKFYFNLCGENEKDLRKTRKDYESSFRQLIDHI